MATLLLVVSLFLWLAVRSFMRQRQRRVAANTAVRSAYFARRFARQLRRWSASARQRLWLRKGCAGAGPLHHRGGSYDVNVLANSRGPARANRAVALAVIADRGIACAATAAPSPAGLIASHGTQAAGLASSGLHSTVAAGPQAHPLVTAGINASASPALICADRIAAPSRSVRAPAAQIAVDLHKVTVTLQSSGRAITSDATLRLAAGHLHAILGRSGSGKSLLLQHIAGRADPAVSQITSGSVRLSPVVAFTASAELGGGYRLGNVQAEQVHSGLPMRTSRSSLTPCRVGYLPQTDVLPEGLTVRETIRCALRLRLALRGAAAVSGAASSCRCSSDSETHGTAATVEAAAASLERLLDLHSISDSIVQTPQQQSEGADAAGEGLGGVEDASSVAFESARGGDVSGGQRKRAALAVELARDAQLYVLDEPTSSLDAASAARLVSALQRFCDARGATVVMSVHQPRAGIFAAFHSVTLLSEGGVAFHGPPAAALPYFRALGFRSSRQSVTGHQASGVRLPTVTDWLADFGKAFTIAPQVVASSRRIARAAPSPLAERSAGARQALEHGMGIQADDPEAEVEAAPDFLLDVLSGFVPRVGFPAFHPSDLAVEWAALVELGAVPWLQRAVSSSGSQQRRASRQSDSSAAGADAIDVATSPIVSHVLHEPAQRAAEVASAYVHFRQRTSVQMHAQLLQRAGATDFVHGGGRAMIVTPTGQLVNTSAGLSSASSGDASSAALSSGLVVGTHIADKVPVACTGADSDTTRSGAQAIGDSRVSLTRYDDQDVAVSVALASQAAGAPETPAWERTMLVHPSSATHSFVRAATATNEDGAAEEKPQQAAPAALSAASGSSLVDDRSLRLSEASTTTAADSRLTNTEQADDVTVAPRDVGDAGSAPPGRAVQRKPVARGDSEPLAEPSCARTEHGIILRPDKTGVWAGLGSIMLTSEWQAAACAVAALTVTAALAAYLEADDTVRGHSNAPIVLVTAVAQTAATGRGVTTGTGEIVFTRTSVLASELTIAHVATVVQQRQIALAATAALLAIDACFLACFTGARRLCQFARPSPFKLCHPGSTHTRVAPLSALLSALLAVAVVCMVAAALPAQATLALSVALMLSRVASAATASQVASAARIQVAGRSVSPASCSLSHHGAATGGSATSAARLGSSDFVCRVRVCWRPVCGSTSRHCGCLSTRNAESERPRRQAELNNPPAGYSLGPAASPTALGTAVCSSTAINVATVSSSSAITVDHYNAGASSGKLSALPSERKAGVISHSSSSLSNAGVTRRKQSRSRAAGALSSPDQLDGDTVAQQLFVDGMFSPRASAASCSICSLKPAGYCFDGVRQSDATSGALNGRCFSLQRALSAWFQQFSALLRRALTQAWRSGRWGGGALLLLFCLGCLVGILFDDADGGDLGSLPLRLLLSTLVVALAAAATPLPILQRSRGLFFHEVAAGVSPTAWLAAVDASLAPLLLLQPAAFLLGSSLFASPSGSSGALLAILMGVHWSATGVGALAASAAPHVAASAVVGAVMVSALLSGFNPSLALYSDKLGLSAGLRDVLLAPSFCRWACEALFLTEAEGECHCGTGHCTASVHCIMASELLQCAYHWVVIFIVCRYDRCLQALGPRHGIRLWL